MKGCGTPPYFLKAGLKHYSKEMNSSMNLIIFGGFLGSGKTSLILSLAHHIVEHEKSFDKPELVIIENEIGDTSIDDKVLKAGGYSVRNLFSGCICCTLSVDLVTTLNDIAKNINPKWVIVECTGLAYPGMVVDTLKKYGESFEGIRTITVVDAERWEMLSDITPVLVETQVKDGDIVLVNKIDLVSEDELDDIEKDIERLNPRAGVFKLSADEGVDEGVLSEVLKING
jgi:G3E family GTPase